MTVDWSKWSDDQKIIILLTVKHIVVSMKIRKLIHNPWTFYSYNIYRYIYKKKGHTFSFAKRNQLLIISHKITHHFSHFQIFLFFIFFFSYPFTVAVGKNAWMIILTLKICDNLYRKEFKKIHKKIIKIYKKYFVNLSFVDLNNNLQIIK